MYPLTLLFLSVMAFSLSHASEDQRPVLIHPCCNCGKPHHDQQKQQTAQPNQSKGNKKKNKKPAAIYQ